MHSEGEAPPAGSASDGSAAAPTPIIRGEGTTVSERYLAALGERAFLNLWAYPNVFTDRGQKKGREGKELCDLFVVCGDDVIIFSDKTIAWPAGDDLSLSWARWYRRAVQHSIEQIRGAERWIAGFEDRIFIDKACTKKLPVRLPPKETRRVHGVVVALGAGDQARGFFNGGHGSLRIDSEVKGDDHLQRPFTVGDVDPGGPFIHVLDDATLDIILGELDTIDDFRSYLVKKSAFFRSGRHVTATGEEDLLAQYLVRTNQLDEHDFVNADRTPVSSKEFAVPAGMFARFTHSKMYAAKKEADQASYVWDRLIELFTTNMLAGTTLVPDGRTFLITEGEWAIRHMALVPRYERRTYGQGILEALERSETTDRFARAFLPSPTSRDKDTGFFFITLKSDVFVREGGYELYRKARQRTLYGYAISFLERHRSLKRIIGIATEPKNKSEGASEDLILVENHDWDEGALAELAEYKRNLEIVVEGQFQEYQIHANEYPDPPAAKPASFQSMLGARKASRRLNRKERRAVAARRRRGDERPN